MLENTSIICQSREQCRPKDIKQLEIAVNAGGGVEGPISSLANKVMEHCLVSILLNIKRTNEQNRHL